MKNIPSTPHIQKQRTSQMCTAMGTHRQEEADREGRWLLGASGSTDKSSVRTSLDPGSEEPSWRGSLSKTAVSAWPSFSQQPGHSMMSEARVPRPARAAGCGPWGELLPCLSTIMQVGCLGARLGGQGGARPVALTWTYSGACGLLKGLTLAEGTSVERGGVGTGPSAFLPATATPVRAG